ncbi:hypothetical protein DV736_g3088, partial [Chaetothyriales sp. CBS 134916]
MEKNEDEWAEFTPDLPLPLFYVGGRYLVFDIKTAAWLRREHNVCGYNVGTLPQSPAQNLFLGLPIMLMPEEAQILVDKGAAYVVDDARAHDQAIYDRSPAREEAYLNETRRQASEVEHQRTQEHAEARERALSKQNPKNKAKSTRKREQVVNHNLLNIDDPSRQQTPAPNTNPTRDNDAQDSSTKRHTTISKSPPASQPCHVTPTSSHHLLHISPTDPAPGPSPPSPFPSKGKRLPGLPTSYPLFQYLHSRGFFMTPGLRFGCQYSTYPGDPLRYHSHFLAVGVGWDEELDLMDLVGGGRLGTGVKKGFLIGSVEPPPPSGPPSPLDEVRGKEEEGTEESAKAAKVRTFTVEWAVM